MRIILFLFLFTNSLLAQQYLTKNGTASFYSYAPIEDIEAVNNKLGGVIDISNGQFAFKIAIQDFIFPNSLMQEHFNESYLDSDKFPFAIFQGTIDSFQSLDLNAKNEVSCSGTLNIHGVSKQVKIISEMQMIDNKINISSNFVILLKDYKIKVPKIVMYNIAEEIKISISASLNKF